MTQQPNDYSSGIREKADLDSAPYSKGYHIFSVINQHCIHTDFTFLGKEQILSIVISLHWVKSLYWYCPYRIPGNSDIQRKDPKG